MKILFVFGTRPEIIKLFPLIQEAEKKSFDYKICFTGQHNNLAVNLLKKLNIKPDYNLKVMTNNQKLSLLTSRLIKQLDIIFSKSEHNLTVVQGDTASAMAASLVSFYNRIKVAHIEAGLRTDDKFSPFPEEINRRMISVVSDFHFCPSEQASKNLVKENFSKKNIFVTGNTVIDACRIISKKIDIEKIRGKYIFLNKKYVLVTIHRRESFGEKIDLFCKIMLKLAEQKMNINFVLPVHPNPNVSRILNSKLKNIKNILLIKPVEYTDFVYMIKKSMFIITDSGGLQEEAFCFNKCVVVLREHTERSEGIKTGKLFLTGINENKFFAAVNQIFDNRELQNSKVVNPFGDGYASKKIFNFLGTLI